MPEEELEEEYGEPTPAPELSLPPSSYPSPPEESSEDDDNTIESTSDLFTVEIDSIDDVVDVEDEDIMGEDDDSLALPEEEDLSDIVEVTDDDIMESAPESKRRYKITRQGSRRVNRTAPATPSMGGVQY